VRRGSASTGGSDSARSVRLRPHIQGAQRPRFIVDNYGPGDEIFLLGFSRGVFTARSTDVFIRNAEILRAEHAARVDQAYLRPVDPVSRRWHLHDPHLTRARECGLALQADAFPASPENATQAPQDRMSPVDPNPLGTLRQSRTAFYPLLPRLIRRPGARAPDHESAPSRAAVGTCRVDRISRCRRSGDTRRGRPAPGNISATARRRKRDWVNNPALVRSETTVWRMR
jgi:hypothetical protein